MLAFSFRLTGSFLQTAIQNKLVQLNTRYRRAIRTWALVASAA